MTNARPSNAWASTASRDRPPWSGTGARRCKPHEYLSIMLGVRRSSITGAMHLLEGEKLIQADRGCVSIRNRAVLETLAGGSYGKPEAEYQRFVGTL